MIFFIITLFIIWRIILFIIAWLGSNFVSFSPRFPYSDILLIPSGLPHWLWAFANFDGVHYLTIAKSGYSAQFTQVFFPLYPLILGFLAKFLPFINPIVIGLFISNFFFLLALLVGWKLFRLDYQTQDVKWIILFLVLFPTSFFFGSLYTESLFLFLALSSFYLARRKRWVLAGILGGLASATRLTGIFLLPALLWEWHMSKFQISNFKFQIKNVRLLSKKILIFIIHSLRSPIIYLIPTGLIFYTLYLQLKFGDFLYFWHAQPIFGAERSGNTFILLPQVIWRYCKILTTISLSSETFWISLTEVISSIIVIFLLVIGYFKKIRISYLIFSWLTVLIPPLTGTFSSMPRYILLAFPIYIVFGLIKSRWLKALLVAISSFLLIFYTILYTHGHWVA